MLAALCGLLVAARQRRRVYAAPAPTLLSMRNKLVRTGDRGMRRPSTSYTLHRSHVTYVFPEYEIK